MARPAERYHQNFAHDLRGWRAAVQRITITCDRLDVTRPAGARGPALNRRIKESNMRITRLTVAASLVVVAGRAAVGQSGPSKPATYITNEEVEIVNKQPG